MSKTSQKWLTIIPPLPEGEFAAQLKRWRDENSATLEGLDPGRFEVEVIKTADGKELRRLRMAIS